MYFYIYKYVYVFLQMLLLCRAGSLYQKLCNYLWGQAAPKEDSEDDLPNCSFASIVYLLPQMATNFGSFFTLLSRFCCCCNFTILKQFLSSWVKVSDDDLPNCSFWPLCLFCCHKRLGIKEDICIEMSLPYSQFTDKKKGHGLWDDSRFLDFWCSAWTETGLRKVLIFPLFVLLQQRDRIHALVNSGWKFLLSNFMFNPHWKLTFYFPT